MNTGAERESPGCAYIGCVLQLVLGIGLFLVVIAFLVESFVGRDGHAEAYKQSECVQNLKHIGIALDNYYNEFRCFPPAYIADADGNPLHSWRVLLLPYFEREAFNKDKSLHELYGQYNFNEPWSGPNNRKLAEMRPHVFHCPSDPDRAATTSYLAVVGAQTAWPGSQTINRRDILDGSPNTVMVVESTESGVNWMEPRDLTYEKALGGINPPGPAPRISSTHWGDGAMVLFCDGSVHFLSAEISKQVLQGLLTAAGGEAVEIPDP